MQKIILIFGFVWFGIMLGSDKGRDALVYWTGQYKACTHHEQQYHVQRLPYIAHDQQHKVVAILQSERACIFEIVSVLMLYVNARADDQVYLLEQALWHKEGLEQYVALRHEIEDEFLLTREEKELEDVAIRCAEFVLRESKEGDDEGCARACRQRQMPWAGDEDEKEDRE